MPADKKKPHHPVRNPNRVWIELERPTAPPGEAREAQAAAIAELATNLLRRIMPDSHKRFLWSEKKGQFMYGDPMGYTYLSDNGEWFNLDYLGRPLTQSADDLSAAN